MTTDDEFTELRDANIPRVDLVDKAANGLPFLLAKSADGGGRGLMDPAFVRDLIAKADPEPAVDKEQDQVTMTGSPGAIAKLIHQASRRAEEPEAAEDVTKTVIAEPSESEDDPDLSVILAEPEDGLPVGSSAVDPGSAAWEAIDAATARKWTSILARAKHALEVMAEREDVEAATADPDDACNAMDLQDAACAVDYAIGVLAPFAVSEQSEADVQELAAVGKALAGFDPVALDTIEVLAQVAKAGRVLSTANEQAIRGAVESLSKVLASLPAPVPDTQDSGRPVAKTQETTMPHPEPELARTTGTVAGAAPTTDTPDIVGKSTAETVLKADGEGKPPAVAVYDAKGKLVGIVDPTDITPISGADAGDDDQSPDPADTDATAEADTDLAPAPPGEVGTPADATGQTAPAVPADADESGVTKTTTADTGTSDEVLKSSILDMVKSMLGEHSAAQTEEIAQQTAAVLELAKHVETLKGQVKVLGDQPAAPRVFTNGAVPPPSELRGQDRGSAATAADVAKASERKQLLYRAPDAGEQNRIAKEMQNDAIAALSATYRR